MSWLAPARKLVSRPIGDMRQLYELVALPHIFVFLILIVAGSLVPEGFAALSQKLCAISYVLVFNISARSRTRALTLILLVCEVAGVSAIVVGFALAFRLDAFLAVHLPIAMAGLTLLLLRLDLGAAFAVSGVALAAAAAEWGISLVLEHPRGLYSSSGALFVLAAYAALLTNAAFRESSGPFVYSPGRPGDDGDESFPRGSSLPVARDARPLRREIASECGSRLAALGLLYSALFVFTAGGAKPLAVAICSSAVALSLVWLLGQRAESVQTIGANHLNVTLSAFVVIGLWCAMSLAGDGPVALDLLSLAIGILALGSMPLPARWALRVAAAFLLVIALALLDAPEPMLPFSILALSLLGALRMGALDRLSRVERSALARVKGNTEVNDAAECAWFLAAAADADSAVTVTAAGETRVVGEESETADRIEPASCAILLKRAPDSPVWAGIIPAPDLGPEHQRNLRVWLGFSPRRVFVVSWGDAARRAAIVPVTFGSMLVGASRVLESLTAIVLGREQALDVHSSSSAQRALQDREREISEMIHLVNNVAQEISGMVDSLRSEPAGGQGGSAEGLPAVQAAAQRLATDVSDYRLLRDLGQLRSQAKGEHVDVGSIALELECYMSARREDPSLAVRRSIPEGAQVRVASRELLAAALRGICRMAIRDRAGASLSSSVEACGSEVVFRISAADDVDFRRCPSDAPAMAAAAAIASASGGRLQVEEGYVAISLPFVIRRPAREGQGKFALLVDNSAEVTTFYARVAEALELEPHTADSVEAADRIVEQHGEPRIVITDLKLGAVHGLTLVTALRQRFGESLPILVVSGDVTPGVSEEVMAAGATRFLPKPVGRRRLFEEIKDVLAG